MESAGFGDLRQSRGQRTSGDGRRPAPAVTRAPRSGRAMQRNRGGEGPLPRIGGGGCSESAEGALLRD